MAVGNQGYYERKTNSDGISSLDRVVAGKQPDHTTATGGLSGGQGGGQPAPLPTYGNVSGSPPTISFSKPPGATSAYAVWTNKEGAGWVGPTTGFPFNLVMSTKAATFQCYATDAGYVQSDTDTESWNLLFL